MALDEQTPSDYFSTHTLLGRVLRADATSCQNTLLRVSQKARAQGDDDLADRYAAAALHWNTQRRPS